MKSISGKLLISFLFVLTVSCSHSQILNPAKWTVEVSKKSVKAGDVVELIFKATIDAKWYMYANDFDPDCGPLITEISFSDIQNFEVVGPTKAINPLSKKDEYFPDCEVIKYFKKTAEFRQKIKVLGGPLKISAVVQGQVCTEIDGACIPFEEDFVIEDITVTGKAVGQKKTEVKIA
jgi:hypothetical protein